MVELQMAVRGCQTVTRQGLAFQMEFEQVLPVS